QPDASSGIFPARVQTLEDSENALEILRVDADAIVTHRKLPLSSAMFHIDVDLRRTFAAVFDGIADEILEYLQQLRGISRNGWQRPMGHHSPTLLDDGCEVRQALLEDCLRVNGLQVLTTGAHPCISQQIANEGLHPAR